MVDTTIIGYVPVDRAGDTMTGNLILNGDPTTPNQAANKNYVDGISAGFDFKESAFAATTNELVSTYNNGVSGVGATLTNNGTQVAFATDGVNPPLMARVLVKNQTNQEENGIYNLTTVGDGSSNWVLTRSSDYDEPAEITQGTFLVVDNGNTLAQTAFIQTAQVSTIGTDSIVFSRFSLQNNIFEENVQIRGVSGSSGSLVVFENADNGTNSVTSVAPDNITSDSTLTMPSHTASGTYVVTTSGVQTEINPRSRIGVTIPDDTLEESALINFGLGLIQSPIPRIGNVYYNPLGCISIDTSSPGIPMSNDTIYLAPINIPAGCNMVHVGIETADASGTADLEFRLYSIKNSTTSVDFAGVALNATAIEENISTTGVKNISFAIDTSIAGLVWLAVRSFNIGTSLVLAAATQTQPNEVYRLLSTGGSVSTPSAFFGISISGQASMPATLSGVNLTGLVSTSFGLAVSAM